MKRIAVLMAALTGVWAAPLQSAESRPPNILFIFSDDHAYQAISAYGDARKLIETPHIDRIAREGMRFDRCLVPNSICGPSRATVLTGKYSHANGFPNNANSRFDGSQPTFPKALQKAGYSTAIIGKWHLMTDPTGFDHWQILPDQGLYYNPPMIRNGVKFEEKGYVTDIITDRSIEWLEKRDKSKPFLLMAQHKAPHRAWEPALRHLNHDNGRVYEEPATLLDDYANRGQAVRDQDMTLAKTYNGRDAKLNPPPQLDAEQRKIWDSYYEPRNDAFRKAGLKGDELTKWRYQRYMHDYLGTIKSVDESVGKLLKYLDENGLAENTIVVYCSDQGFFLGEHGWFDKRWIFEESLRTPLLVRWPAKVKAGGQDENLVSTVDFAQTFLELAGAAPLADAQGRSFAPLLKGEQPADWRKSFYYHYYEYPQPHQVRPHYGVVTQRYKLVHFYGPDVDYWELYDREKDPQELKSFYGAPEYAEAQKELHAELIKLRSTLHVPSPDPPGFSGHREAPTPRQRRARAQPEGGTALMMELDFSVASASRVPDGSTNRNHGVFTDGTAPERAPGEAPSWKLGGKGHVQVANHESLDPSESPWTVEAVVKVDAAPGIILARGGGAFGYALSVNDAGKPVFTMNSKGVTTQVTGTESVSGKWTHLAGIISADRKALLYVNGKQVAETVLPELITRNPSDSMQIGADTGSEIFPGSGSQPLQGLIQRVRVYHGARTGEQIAHDSAAVIKTTTVQSAPGRPPNIVLIFTDDLGYADVGVQNGDLKNRFTPSLDAMAAQGIRFDRFYVPQPVCSASRAAILTGCYPNRLGIHGALPPNSKTGLNPSETTLAELLQQKGYATAAIGKWHLGDAPEWMPTAQGFDNYYGLPYSNDMWPLHPEARPGAYPPLPLYENDRVLNANVSADDQTHLTRDYTQRAVQFIDKHQDQPFLLYLAHSMPHVPLYAHAEFQGKSGHGLYADVIQEIDWSVGEILRALQERGLDENTLVMFTSDNGPWLSYGAHGGIAAPLREGKGTVWEGGVRVPFIARWPAGIPAGRVCQEPAMTIDLFPTIAALTGASLPHHKLDGLDIRPLLTGDTDAKNPHAGYYFYYKQNELQAVMSGDWKLYLPHQYRTLGQTETRENGKPVKYRQAKLETLELYNVRTDPGEQQNVAANNAQVLDRLLILAEAAREDLGDSLEKRFGVGIREAAMRQQSKLNAPTP